MTDAKTKWTAGNWYVSGVRSRIDRNEYHAVQVEGGPQICVVWYDPKTHEGYADARLIAAAPDLYEALEAMLPENCGPADDPSGERRPRFSKCESARKVLAKARGES